MLIPSHNQISDHVPPFSWAPANAVHIGFKTFMNLYFSFKPNFVHIFFADVNLTIGSVDLLLYVIMKIQMQHQKGSGLFLQCTGKEQELKKF